MYEWIYDRVIDEPIGNFEDEVTRRAAKILTPSLRAILRYGRCKDKILNGSLTRRGRSARSPVTTIYFYLLFQPKSSYPVVGRSIATALELLKVPIMQVGVLHWPDEHGWRPLFEAYTPDGVAEQLGILVGGTQMTISDGEWGM